MKTAYINGKIYTITHGFCEAFVVDDTKFSYVGKSDEALRKADEVIDLQGQFVTCGFNDSHMHLLGYGHTLEMINLAKCTDSMAHLKEAVKAYIQEKNWSSGVFLRGRGWNNDYFSDTQRFLNRYDLDEVSLDIPLVLTRACGHVCVVNTKALEILGVDKTTSQVEGGHFDVDEMGEPLGIFRENAMSLIYNPISKVSVADLKRMIQSACEKLNSYGITSCQTDDFTNFNVDFRDVIEAYRSLEKEGRLSVKVNQQCQLPTMALLSDFVENGYHQLKTNLYKNGPLKLLGDGSLGARTAFLSYPYADDEKAQGISCFSQSQLDELISYAHQHNMPVAVHCIGDGMMKMVVESYRKVLANQPNNLRHGIVHCQITDEELLQAFEALHLHAYIQPIFLDYDITMVEKRLGHGKAQKTYAFKTLYRIEASGGSDCPVELPNVMQGIQCAVTRKTLHGTGPFVVSEALSVEEALNLFTLKGAYASLEEKEKGSIEVGKAADFVILTGNPFKVNPMDLGKIEVKETYMNGQQVYACSHKNQ